MFGFGFGFGFGFAFGFGLGMECFVVSIACTIPARASLPVPYGASDE